MALALGSPFRSDAQAPAFKVVGKWSYTGSTVVQTSRQAKHTKAVTTTTIKCNTCPDVVFLANGRGAVLSEGSVDTLSRFQWQVTKGNLTLRFIGPEMAETTVLPTGTYHLRAAAPLAGWRRLELVDKRGEAHQLSGGD